MVATPKVVEVDAWAMLRTVLKNDLEHWQHQQAEAFINTTAPDEVVKLAMSLIANNISLTEYYIELMEKIENGELIDGKESG